MTGRAWEVGLGLARPGFGPSPGFLVVVMNCNFELTPRREYIIIYVIWILKLFLIEKQREERSTLRVVNNLGVGSLVWPMWRLFGVFRPRRYALVVVVVVMASTSLSLCPHHRGRHHRSGVNAGAYEGCGGCAKSIKIPQMTTPVSLLHARMEDVGMTPKNHKDSPPIRFYMRRR
jgi:hypothetical protein